MKSTLHKSSDDTGSPNRADVINARFLESDYGNVSGYKVLVAYASGYGTTSEVADVVGQVLSEGGATVETRRIRNVNDVGKYDAVIVGSAIQYDRWMPEARRFVTANKNVLSKLPVAYFFTCLTLSRRTEKTMRQAKAYSDKLHLLAPEVAPVSVGRFAGVLDYGRLPFFISLIFKGVFSIIGLREGDYRDWDTIRDWAHGIQSELN